MEKANYDGLRLKIIKHPLKKKHLPKRDVIKRDFVKRGINARDVVKTDVIKRDVIKRNVIKRDVSNKSLLDKHEPAANSLLDTFVGASPPLIFPPHQFNRLRFGNISTILPPLTLPTARSAISTKIPENVRIALEAASRRLNSLLSRVKEGSVDMRFLIFEVQGIRTTLRTIDGERARNAERAMEQIREREKLRRERFRQLTNRDNISKLLPFGIHGPVVGAAAPNSTESSNLTGIIDDTANSSQILNNSENSRNKQTPTQSTNLEMEEKVGESLMIVSSAQNPTTQSTPSEIVVTVTPVNYNSTTFTSQNKTSQSSVRTAKNDLTMPSESGFLKKPTGLDEKKMFSNFGSKLGRDSAKGRLSDIIKNPDSSAKNGSVIEDLRKPSIIVQPPNTIVE